MTLESIDNSILDGGGGDNNNNNNNSIGNSNNSFEGPSILEQQNQNQQIKKSTSFEDEEFNSLNQSNQPINIIDDSNTNYIKKSKKHKQFFTPPHFIQNKRFQRGLSLFWGIVTILISGTLYGFSIISNEVRDILHYNQTKISTAISIGDVGIYIGISVGYFFDLFGPFYTLLLASSLYILGYMGVWGVVNGTLNSNVGLLSFFLFLVGQGSHASFTAAIVPNVHNYTIKHRGKISGGLVGCFALSSGLFGIIYKSTFKKNNDVLGYILFLSILLSSISLVGAFIIREVKIGGVNTIQDDTDSDNEQDENVNADNEYSIGNSSKSTALNSSESLENLKSSDSTDSINKLTNNSSSTSGGGVNNDGSSGDLSSNINESGDNVMTNKKGKFNLFINNISKNTNHSDYKKLIEDFEDESSQHLKDLNPNYLDGKRDISGIKLLKMLEFWLMWIVYFFAAGNSLMFLNNLAVMCQAFDRDTGLHSDLVIVFAVSNLAGRTMVGFLSDVISKKYSRFWCVIIGSSIISITHLLSSFNLNVALIPATVFTGIGYGFIVSIMVSLTSLRFGQRRFGINFGFIAISSASASLLFTNVSSSIYDTKSINGEKCKGTHCFQLSLLLSFIFNFISIFIIGFLIYHLRRQQLSKFKK